MNPLPKAVVSKELQSASWENSTILREVAAIADYKASSSGDILIYGSASMVQELARRSLIDEDQLLVHPILLGGGTSLFGDMGQRQNLNRVNTENFASGIVLNVSVGLISLHSWRSLGRHKPGVQQLRMCALLDSCHPYRNGRNGAGGKPAPPRWKADRRR